MFNSNKYNKNSYRSYGGTKDKIGSGSDKISPIQ